MGVIFKTYLGPIKNKIQTAEWETQKAKFPNLEAQTEKLNHLIARNDRAGVAKLLEDYLPWPLMEPTEKKAWSTWIESIRNPDPSNKELIFRGKVMCLLSTLNFDYLTSSFA